MDSWLTRDGDVAFVSAREGCPQGADPRGRPNLNVEPVPTEWQNPGKRGIPTLNRNPEGPNDRTPAFRGERSVKFST